MSDIGTKVDRIIGAHYLICSGKVSYDFNSGEVVCTSCGKVLSAGWSGDDWLDFTRLCQRSIERRRSERALP